jgi:hypothetical protein
MLLRRCFGEEKWLSGRKQFFAKEPIAQKAIRGFESHLLRHFKTKSPKWRQEGGDEKPLGFDVAKRRRGTHASV